MIKYIRTHNYKKCFITSADVYDPFKVHKPADLSLPLHFQSLLEAEKFHSSLKAYAKTS